MYRRTNYTLFPAFVAAAVAATVVHFVYFTFLFALLPKDIQKV